MNRADGLRPRDLDYLTITLAMLDGAETLPAASTAVTE
jgi:hypothetical protein